MSLVFDILSLGASKRNSNPSNIGRYEAPVNRSRKYKIASLLALQLPGMVEIA